MKKHKGETMAHDTVRERTHDRVDQWMDKAEDIGEGGRNIIVRLKSKANQMKGNVDGYVRRNPEKSIMVATGIGVAIGALLIGKLMKQKREAET